MRAAAFVVQLRLVGRELAVVSHPFDGSRASRPFSQVKKTPDAPTAPVTTGATHSHAMRPIMACRPSVGKGTG
jgi:hypothetical protein